VQYTNNSCGTPILVNGVVYYKDSNNIVYARNANNGDLIWSIQLEEKHIRVCSPTLEDGILYISNGLNELFAIKADTGEIIWKHQFDGDNMSGTPVLYNDKIFYAPEMSGYIYALDKKAGTVLWKTRLGMQEYAPEASLIAFNNKVYYSYSPVYDLNESGDGYIGAIDIETGNKVWENNYDGAIFNISFTEPYIYTFEDFLNEEDKLLAINPSNGLTVHSFKINESPWLISIYSDVGYGAVSRDIISVKLVNGKVL
jgi:outer membrane protein assembly factor BamB